MLSLIALAAAQGQGVSWDSAPECPDSQGGTAVDTQGRTWGWHNGQSCKRSSGSPPNPSSPPGSPPPTPAQQQQQSWDNAPPCSYAATSDNSKPDSQGRLWGWQDGRSCRHSGSVVAPAPPTSPTPPSPPAVSWDTAPACNYQATTANSRADKEGRYWGWQDGNSCKFTGQPILAPPPTPPTPPYPPSPPAPPAPLKQPAPPAPTQRQQLVPSPKPYPAPPMPPAPLMVSPAPSPKTAGEKTRGLGTGFCLRRR